MMDSKAEREIRYKAIATLFRHGNIRGERRRKAKASWDYFGFDPRERYGWSALLSENEAMIVTDENRDLNTSTIFPDADEFINWLEAICEG